MEWRVYHGQIGSRVKVIVDSWVMVRMVWGGLMCRGKVAAGLGCMEMFLVAFVSTTSTTYVLHVSNYRHAGHSEGSPLNAP
jgi:hypothetical protein